MSLASASAFALAASLIDELQDGCAADAVDDFIVYGNFGLDHNHSNQQQSTTTTA